MPVDYRIIAARRDFSKTDRPGPVRGNRFYNGPRTVVLGRVKFSVIRP
jgi:hypothetical protein